MCGIAGSFGLRRNQPDRGFALAACAAMVHRGPDEHGSFDDERISLAMCRLKILGLVGGEQPAFSSDRSVVAVVNGEIYNHHQLRALLESRGRRVEGTSDVHVIPELYREFGLDFVDHLHGMFAVALYDSARERLILATDRVGKKPIYLSAHSQEIVFASELTALRRHPQVSTDVNPEALDQYLSFRIVGAPSSIFGGVERVRPATVIEFDRDGQRTDHEYWTFPFTGDGSSTVDDIDDLLVAAVDARLESAVPLGAMLSGGLDSSLVVALASRRLGRGLHTFSVGFDHPAFDESAQARLVADAFGTHHHTVTLTADDALASLDRVLEHTGEPFAFPSAIASDAMYRLASEHVTVVLTGDGSDEIFCGYGRYSRLLQTSGGDLDRRYADVLVDGVPTETKHRIYSDRFRDTLPGHPIDHLRGRFASTDPATADLDRAMAVDSRFWLADAQLVKIDRMSMAHSIEPRSPFLDHRLIEHVARIPASRKLVDGEEKVLLKQVAARYLPESIVTRRKQELAVPLEAWLGATLRREIDTTLLSDRALERGYFDPDALRRFVTDADGSDSYALWTLFVLERWHRLHVDQDSAASAHDRPLISATI
ncbi:asparagine synthase (glutamine-hydrolyzing) [Rhodococcus sp. 06-235-1A]|uniref:asparagine synthase (glutamine-hydrolyzing) n=1 Tax=Rhodococcus sp. 06-235-1A TaxID=2022508 RepID=UPI000B9C0277|nr:asparagine synthase (glutamine-hydrolyzing) [Rhodococcus sp. 06-235-1A]OZD01210.1 asparagine synthase (glutamine-hydrolyzing) [Rhodococcus sp. 06-235-1A]